MANGLGGGVWVLLVSVAALRAAALPTALNYLGIVGGVAGLVRVIPALEGVGAVFGVGLTVWFVWLGIIMLRDSQEPMAHGPGQPSPASTHPQARETVPIAVRYYAWQAEPRSVVTLVSMAME